MESELTKRRPSIIPGCLPGLPGGWTPSIGTLEEGGSDEDDDNDLKKSMWSNALTYLPPITEYETKPWLTIKKFRLPNQQTMSSMAHTHGICVLNTDDEEIIACDHYNNRLLMFDSNTDGRLLESFRGDLATPDNVCARPNYRQQVYVTKAHSISLYDLEKKKFIQKLGGEESGHANNRFSSPTGIAVDSDNG